jgi:hypothetical protein
MEFWVRKDGKQLHGRSNNGTASGKRRVPMAQHAMVRRLCANRLTNFSLPFWQNAWRQLYFLHCSSLLWRPVVVG